MINKIIFDSDELFDTTSNESGEEYIPGTSEDTNSDKSISLDLMNHKKTLSVQQRMCRRTVTLRSLTKQNQIVSGFSHNTVFLLARRLSGKKKYTVQITI